MTPTPNPSPQGGGEHTEFAAGSVRHNILSPSMPHERHRQAPLRRHAADRTHCVFADRRTRAAETAGGGSHGGVVHRQRGGVGHPVADAAHGAHATCRWCALARHSELGLARIRQPRRLLAHAEGIRRIPRAGDARDQRLGDCRLSADRRGRECAQMGVHRSRLHPAQHAEGRGRARRHPPHARSDHARPPASRRAAGSVPASPKHGRRRTCWWRKATTTSATGCSTISRCG